MLRVLDLFSGIGAFSLGLERTGGFRTVAFCEIEAFPRKVLARHWPGVPIYDDVRTLTADRLAADGIAVDVICGGFPCTDISLAGKGAGIDGAQSGLWSEIARLAGELRPRYIIVENTAALLSRGLDRVLGDLAALGFDTEWNLISAAAMGAPHRRDRLWLVAYPIGDPLRLVEQRLSWGWPAGISAEGQAEPGDDGGGWQILGLTQHAVEQGASGDQPDRRGAPGRRHGADVADAQYGRRQAGHPEARSQRQDAGATVPCGEGDQAELPATVGADGGGLKPGVRRVVDGFATGLHGDLRWPHEAEGLGIWQVEPDIPRVALGVRNRVARLKALGNSLVPQIPEMIGRAILAHEKGPPERA